MTVNQLSPVDTMFLSSETPCNPIAIAMLWVCDPGTSPLGALSYKEIFEFLKTRVEADPGFQCKLYRVPDDIDYPYWVPHTDIDFVHHIRHLVLPEPGGWKELSTLVGALHNRHMDHSRPLWEIYVIDGLDGMKGTGPGSFALMFRFHHAFVDGKALMELLDGLTSETPVFEPAELPESCLTEPEVDGLEHLIIPWKRGLKRWQAGMTSVKKSWELVSRLTSGSRPDQLGVPHTMFSAKLTNDRIFDAVSWKITDLKAIRKLQPGVSLNDVLTAIIAGGMRRYLISHDDFPAEKSLVAISPISIRHSEASEEGGNQLSMMLISLGTDIANPVERLKKIHERTTRGISLGEDVIGEWNSAFMALMPITHEKDFRVVLSEEKKEGVDLSALLSPFNTTITNVPGPRKTQYFSGAKIVRAHLLANVFEGAAVTHAITGMGPLISLNVISDGAVMADVDFYIKCMNESMQEYRSAAKEAKN